MKYLTRVALLLSLTVGLTACGQPQAAMTQPTATAALVTIAPTTPSATKAPPTAPATATPTPVVDRSVSLSFVGDCTFGSINDTDSSRGFPALYKAAGSLTYPFDLVKRYFESDDLTVINFEGTLTTASQLADKEFHFRGDAAYAQILPAASVEVALLSNNHAHDYLEPGFADTLAAMDAAGAPVVYQDKPLVTTINGVQVVVIGDCSVVGENTPATEGVAERVTALVQRYQAPDTLVIVDMHWGSEGDAAPTAWQQASARAWIDAGADLVVGQHAHNVQGIETYNGKYILYSLGNFAFGGNGLAFSKDSLIANVVFTLTADGSRRAQLAVVPCYITSTDQKNERGVLYNNYQPLPLTGEAATATLQLLLDRSKVLQNGVTELTVWSPETP